MQTIAIQKNILKAFICFAAALFCSISFSQKNNHNWYFGNKAAISFNTSPPTAIQNSAMESFEGCGSVSDDNGNLLFYTDGATIWDKNNTPMPNGTGIYGHSSAYQGVTIIPKPGNQKIYYVFTTSAQELINNKALHYSVVDMNLNNGLGDVILNQKNIPLLDSVSEKITSTFHHNGLFVWVITTHLTKGLYYSYLIDCDGVNHTPVISQSLESSMDVLGEIVISNDGTKYVTSSNTPKELELGDFNNATGMLTPTIRFPFIDTINNIAFASSLAFSPNDRFLYVLGGLGNGLYQYDLSQPNFVNSILFVGGLAGQGLPPIAQNRKLQLGPDHKIYVSQFFTPFLGTINVPDSQGTGCQYLPSQINLQGNDCRLSLPGKVYKYNPIKNGIISNSNCFQLDVDFDIEASLLYDSLQWHFGDTASGYQNFSTIPSPSHSFTTSGTFQIQLIRYFYCIIDTFVTTISVNQLPKIEFTPSPKCVGDTTFFHISQEKIDSSNYTFTWTINNELTSSDTSFYYIFGNFGNYDVQLIMQKNECIDTLTVPFSIHSNPAIEITASNQCSQEATLNATVKTQENENYELIWNTYKNNVLINSFYENPLKVNTKDSLSVKLIVISEFGCDTQITESLIFTPLDTNIQLPNVLSLNSTLGNDIINFNLISPELNLCMNYQYSIYNRWGTLVYSFQNDKNNPDLNCTNCFKGKTTDGNPLSTGTYFYVLRGENDFIRKGTIRIFD